MTLKKLAACAPFIAVVALTGCDQPPGADNHDRASVKSPTDLMMQQPVGSHALVTLPGKKNYYELIVKTGEKQSQDKVNDQGVAGKVVCSEFRTLRAQFTDPAKLSVVYKTHENVMGKRKNVYYQLQDMTAESLLHIPAKFNDGKKTGYTQIPQKEKCAFVPN